MESLKKLDNTIEQLERQSRDLEEFARIYKLISSLKSDIESSQAKIVENNDGFSELVDKTQRINEQQSDERNRRHESVMQSHQSLLKEFDDVSDKISYLSGRINGNSRP